MYTSTNEAAIVSPESKQSSICLAGWLVERVGCTGSVAHSSIWDPFHKEMIVLLTITVETVKC